MNLSPVKLKPVFKEYLWGGTKLKTIYDKKTELEKVAESWELSAHKDGQSTIDGGSFDGLTLSEYINENGNEILGKKALEFDFFPILIKFIDAADSLSVQVHPDDEYALKNEGEYGKTEVWYVLDCEEGSSLYYGFNRTVTKDELRKRIAENTILEVLNKVPVKKGDVFFIESGTVHAIGKGMVICEIQQNSNTTYRVYDYDRRDKSGKARELHIEKAIEVARLTPSEKHIFENKNIIAACKYFTCEKVDVSGTETVEITDECFKSIIVTSGEGKLFMSGETLAFKAGDSIFVPAQNKIAEIHGQCELIVSYV